MPAAPSAPYAMNIHDWQAAARSGRWRRDCRYTLCSELNSQPKRPGDLDLWPFDPESGVRVTSDVGYLCTNFGLPRPLCSRLRPDVCDRRQTDRRQTKASLNAPPPIRGKGITSCRRAAATIYPRPRLRRKRAAAASSQAGRAGPDQPIRAIQPAGRTHRLLTGCTRQTSDQCSRIRILCFFFIFQKNMTFYVFLKWRIKKS